MAAHDPRALVSAVPEAPASDAPRLLDRVRATVRMRHYSRKTEKTYVGWIRRFISAHDGRHPAEMGVPEVARSARQVVRELARLLAPHEVPGLVDEQDGAAGEHRRPRLCGQVLRLVSVALDRPRDVLDDREHHRPQYDLWAAPGIEHDDIIETVAIACEKLSGHAADDPGESWEDILDEERDMPKLVYLSRAP